MVDPASGELTGEPLAYDPGRFTTHGVIVGMTGSGKTGFGITVLEEALLSGVPVLAIDPKGDLGNLALRFPDLAGSDFAPWVQGRDPGAVAAQRGRDWPGGASDPRGSNSSSTRRTSPSSRPGPAPAWV